MVYLIILHLIQIMKQYGLIIVAINNYNAHRYLDLNINIENIEFYNINQGSILIFNNNNSYYQSFQSYINLNNIIISTSMWDIGYPLRFWNESIPSDNSILNNVTISISKLSLNYYYNLIENCVIVNSDHTNVVTIQCLNPVPLINSIYTLYSFIFIACLCVFFIFFFFFF